MAELLGAWAPLISRATLLPSSGGRFEVKLDGELIFSKKETGRFPEEREVIQLLPA